MRWISSLVMAFVLAVTLTSAHAESPNGVKTLEPPGAIKAVGTWSLGARAGDFIFVAGMQGIDPATNTLVKDPQARILQAFRTSRGPSASSWPASSTAPRFSNRAGGSASSNTSSMKRWPGAASD